MLRLLAASLCGALVGGALAVNAARAADPQPGPAEQSAPAAQPTGDTQPPEAPQPTRDTKPGGAATATNLVKQANAPLSTIMQLRFQDTLQPEFEHNHDDGNVASLAITMPLPRYRLLLPLPQLSLLVAPAAVSPPDGPSGFGDLRFTNVAIVDPGYKVLLGVGFTLVFPTATEPEVGQEKWQAGPAAAVAYAPKNWIFGFLAQNPISFAGDDDRRNVNALFLQPFITYQLGGGWFIRSVPQMLFNWEDHEEIVPIDLGAGRVLNVWGQTVNCFIEPFWSPVNSENGPTYGITFGIGLLYPNFWGS